MINNLYAIIIVQFICGYIMLLNHEICEDMPRWMKVLFLPCSPGLILLVSLVHVYDWLTEK